MKKISILILFPILLMSSGVKPKPTVEQLFSVQTIKVKSLNTSHLKKNYGFVKAEDNKVYDVSPRFDGYVEKLYVNKKYQYVKKGQALVKVFSPDVYKAKEDLINSYNYSNNGNNYGIVESSIQKLKLLGISKKEIQQLKDRKGKKLNKEATYTTIYSPASGYIFKKNITNGSAFKSKENIFKIINLDEVWVEVKIFEKDLNWIKKSKDFRISFKTTNKIYKSKSKLLYPNINEKEATLTLRLKVKNNKHELFPGMYANVISKDKNKDYLILPKTAVIFKNNKYYSFVVGEYEGEYEPLEIKIKPLNNNEYIILEGLELGDEVVNNALFMMDSDAQINGLY